MLLALQIFFVICCVVLILVVLMQRSEGDGVAGMLGGGQGEAIFGTKTVNVLARFTSGLAVVMLVLIIVLQKMGSSDKSIMDDIQTPAPTPVTKATEAPETSKTVAEPVAKSETVGKEASKEVPKKAVEAPAPVKESVPADPQPGM